jgi:hypothetical protein
MGTVLDINVIGWRCDKQINTTGSDLFCGKNIIIDNPGLPVIKKKALFHAAPVCTTSLFFPIVLRLKVRADRWGTHGTAW